MATSSVETYVKGTLQWTDDAGINHPLRRVMVRIYDKEPIGTTHLGTVYTDNSGNFSYTFTNPDGFGDFENGGYDIFVRIYAGDTNAMVEIGDSGDEYYYESTVSENVSTGSTVTRNFTFSMSNDLGKAFQISQAVLTARDYAWNMMGEMPSDVTVRYPYDSGCYYNRGSKRITITGNAPSSSSDPNSYASWDVIMHEYGHHIQYEVDIINSSDWDHSSYSNDADALNNKDEGIRLAWSESWPTVFGAIAQRYYSGYLSNIATVGDSSYTSYNGLDYDIETTSVRLGEACEQSIMAVLWDLYDSSNDNNDTISLGYTSYWNVTTGNQSKTFSNFIGYFYEQYPSYIDDIGTNLTYYRMATSKPYISNSSSVSQTVPPTFKWSAQGGSSTFPNNSFVLIFYNSSGTEILRTATTTSNTYTLTQSEWNSVLYSYGKTYTVAVAATQTASPTTGEYISARSVSYTKPAPANLSQTFNIAANNRYTEKIVNLQPGQYIEYNITFASGGNKLIQTFGTKDTVLELYSSDGTLLLGISDTDDDGYSANAMLSYNFSVNTEYKLRVKFFSSSEYGTTKVVILPTYSYATFEDIYNLTDYTMGLTWNFEQNNVKIMTYKYSTTQELTMRVTSEVDTYLYIIDPRSTEPIKAASISTIGEDNLYNDDYGVTLNSQITKIFDAYVPYLVIVSAHNPSSSTSVGEFFVDFD